MEDMQVVRLVALEAVLGRAERSTAYSHSIDGIYRTCDPMPLYEAHTTHGMLAAALVA